MGVGFRCTAGSGCTERVICCMGQLGILCHQEKTQFLAAHKRLGCTCVAVPLGIGEELHAGVLQLAAVEEAEGIVPT